MTIDRDGRSLRPATARSSDGSFDLELRTWGRSEAHAPAAPAEVVADDKPVCCDDPAWSKGYGTRIPRIGHEFTIAAHPFAEDGGLLALSLAFEGLAATRSEDAHTLSNAIERTVCP